jgi:beta-glucanase (GH16 family)
MYRIVKTQFHRALPLVLIFFAVLGGAPVVANAQTLVWSDEFDSGTNPNPDVWTADLGNWGWGNNELQNYTSDPANLRVENGNLVITAQKSGDGGGASFTSARIKTLDKLTVKYGTIEARIKVPDLGNGLWPAFWTLGNNIQQVGWPACGELDVMEMGHVSAINEGVVNSRMGSAAHWDSNGYASYGEFYDAPNDLNDDYHTFRMEWTPDSVSTYVDGSWVWSMDISSAAEFSEFHAPHFILLNLAVGGSFTGIINPAGITAPFSAEYLIDYIRIYDNGHTVLGGSSLDGTPPAASTLLDNLANIDAHVSLDVTRTYGDDDGLLSQIIIGDSNVQIGGFGVWGKQLNDGNVKFAIFEAVFFQFEPGGATLTAGEPVYISDAIAQVAATDQWFDSPALSLVLNANTTYYMGLISDQPFTFRYSTDAPALTQNGLTSGQAGIAGANGTMRTFAAPFMAESAGTGQPAIRIEAAQALIDNGDTTIDTASGLEWLDLTATQGVTAQDVLAGFGGFIDDGWTFATVDQVCGLLGALGDDTINCTTGAVGVQMDPANAETFVNLLGNTLATGRGTYGMFNNIGGFPDNFGLACINDTATSCTGGGSSSWLTLIGWASGYQTVGSFLVRPTTDADSDSDSDGVTDDLDQCPDTLAGATVDASGCPASTTRLIDNGSTTIDTASGLEWLDLIFTQGLTAQDVLAGFGGYIAAGWTFATVDQVCGLFGALGDDTTNCTTGAVGVQMDPANAESFVNLLGNTAATGRGAYGMFNNIGGFPDNFGLACINDTATSCTGGGSSSWLTLTEWANGYQTVGSFLVRPTTDADGDGVPDAGDQCPGTPADTTVNASGCALETSLNLEAEEYTAYWDSDPGSNGDAGNPGDDVDIEATTDVGGGRNLGWAAAGEWLEYQVNLSAGVYAVNTRVASEVSTGAYDLLLDDVVFGSDTVPSTGGWQVWETHSVGSITVSYSGLHTLRVNVTGNDFNLNWIELTQAADADGDGVPDSSDQCPGTPGDTPVDAVGC